VDKTGVENAIVDEVLQRFCLTEKWSTFQSRYVAECLGLVETSADAERVLKNDFEPSEDIDDCVRAVLENLAMPEAIKKLGTLNINFLSSHFQLHWKQAREFTSSSLSGLQFGHYKAVAFSILLSKIYAIKVHLAVLFGKPLNRWAKGLQCMLLKERGNFLVNKLQAILLLEADYNWMTSELIGRCLLSHSTAADEVPREHFGGLKYKSAIDMAVCRVLN
jgi:hypothetical protein